MIKYITVNLPAFPSINFFFKLYLYFFCFLFLIASSHAYLQVLIHSYDWNPYFCVNFFRELQVNCSQNY